MDYLKIVNMVIVQSMWVMLGLYRNHIMENHLRKDNGKSNGNWGQLLGTVTWHINLLRRYSPDDYTPGNEMQWAFHAHLATRKHIGSEL